MENFRNTSNAISFSQWREDIPLLCKKNESKYNPKFIYLDSAATSLKAQPVIDKIIEYYSEYPANIHRGSYKISIDASIAYERTRDTVRTFLSARTEYEVIFTSGMTYGSNFLALAFKDLLTQQDQIALTELEHHSSFLPWIEVAKSKKLLHHVIPILEDGTLDMDKMYEIIPQCRILSIVGMSNVTGYVPPLKEIYELCERSGCIMILDAAQLAAHKPINLLDTPYHAVLLSAHKLGGPTGTGVLCIKKDILNTFSQVISGGGTVDSVSLQAQHYRHGPEQFEPGTPHIAGVIGLGAAIHYLHCIGFDNLAIYEKELRHHLIETVAHTLDFKIVGDKNISDTAIVSVVSEKFNSQDICFILDQNNVCIRAGMLCAQPLINALQHSQVIRISCYGYNIKEDIDTLSKILNDLR